MKCGCVAQAVQRMPDGSERPACVVHDPPDSITVAEVKPDLTGRKARCAYFGRGGFRNHGPIYGGGKCSRQRCGCLVDSDYGLPFFEYAPKWAKSIEGEDRFFCGCAGWD